MTAPETESVTRRALIRTGVNVGVGAGIVWGIGTDYATSDDTVEIEYALVREPGDGSLVARTRTVPAEWYAKTRAAFAAQRRLRQTPLSALVGSFVVPGRFDDPNAALSVDATAESVVDRVVDLASGVDVDVNVVDEFPPKPDPPRRASNPYEVTDLNRRRVPGGVHCRSPAMSGTLAPAAFDAESGRRCFVTANHLYGEKGTKTREHSGDSLDLRFGRDARTIGHVERGYPEADFVRVRPTGGAVPAPAVRRADPPRVVGQLTKIGLADMLARDEKLHKFGAFSGESEGYIRGVDGFTCYIGEVCKPGQLKWGGETTMTDGDSGSVNYAPDPEHPDEYVLVGGLNNARSWWPGADFTWGTAAFHLLEEYGIHF